MGSAFRSVAARFLKLPRKKNGIRVERNVEMRTRDGVILIADRYFPKDGKPRPTVLVRSPYGRGFLLAFSAALLAERGLTVVVQSVRATDGSGGVFDPVRQERADGADAVHWVRDQPWFGGKLYLFGGSYLGFTAWAIATECPELVDGAAITVSQANFGDALLEGGGLAQFTALNWTRQMHDSITSGTSPFFGGKPVNPATFMHLPVGTMDQAAFGATESWWQDWVNRRDLADPWWRAMDFSAGVTALRAPTLLIAGWQDLFLPYQLEDLTRRLEAGLPTWITVGPWEHGGPGGLFEGQRQAIEFLSGLAHDDPRGPVERAPLRLYVQGADEWRTFDNWPPKGTSTQEYHLHGGGALREDRAPEGTGSSAYVYDPADPTPSLYGPVTMPQKSRDLSPYDHRSDVVSFTTGFLSEDLEIIGPVSVDLFVRTDNSHFDLYVALAEVNEKGTAQFVSSGYRRIEPGPLEADGSRRVTIPCWPTAWRFAVRRKLRIYVASACFPRYARNLGTGEPMATGTAMVKTRVEVLHDALHPSLVRVSHQPAGYRHPPER
ncbi:hypothetical protein BES08_29630 (plasmid) [Novosphingobium resinovorum]|uniref:Xaa-Pro dipeptidyl-peptidase C-terminal domain-containing protein n=1 Tax=Novosphingobium resinovorum TaxID=158500 RepID=A0A1D8AGR3_9SPHN|nr:hypothetical protein BES08_29630 [Novosphingobium resinovorum]